MRKHLSSKLLWLRKSSTLVLDSVAPRANIIEQLNRCVATDSPDCFSDFESEPTASGLACMAFQWFAKQWAPVLSFILKLAQRPSAPPLDFGCSLFVQAT